MHLYCVYMLSNDRRVLYIGVSGRLVERIYEHKHGLADGFTKKYRLHSLVWYECYEQPIPAIEREKQLKRWSRIKKIRLIEAVNPTWRDLYQEL
jgi:putative endonuclease